MRIIAGSAQYRKCSAAALPGFLPGICVIFQRKPNSFSHRLFFLQISGFAIQRRLKGIQVECSSDRYAANGSVVIRQSDRLDKIVAACHVNTDIRCARFIALTIFICPHNTQINMAHVFTL